MIDVRTVKQQILVIDGKEYTANYILTALKAYEAMKERQARHRAKKREQNVQTTSM